MFFPFTLIVNFSNATLLRMALEIRCRVGYSCPRSPTRNDPGLAGSDESTRAHSKMGDPAPPSPPDVCAVQGELQTTYGQLRTGMDSAFETQAKLEDNQQEVQSGKALVCGCTAVLL